MEVTQSQLDALRESFEKKLDVLNDSKVGYSHFYWVIGTMIMVIGSILAFQISLIMGLYSKVDATQNDVSGLLGEWKQWTKY